MSLNLYQFIGTDLKNHKAMLIMIPFPLIYLKVRIKQSTKFVTFEERGVELHRLENEQNSKPCYIHYIQISAFKIGIRPKRMVL
jgi:hypothetical protein